MAVLSVRVTPRSAKPGVGEWKSDPAGRPYLELRVAASPTDGMANAEVVKLLAKALGLPKSRLVIVGGEAARLKRIDTPLSEIELRDRL